MSDSKVADSDLNELLGSDSDGEVMEKKKGELNELLGSDDESVVEKKNDKSDINDLLGDSDDEDDYPSEKKDDQKHIDDYFAKDESDGKVDELEQILGKAETKPAAKEMKAKTRSKVLMHPTYKVPATDSAMFVRTPNFIKIQPAEYNQSLYEADSERKVFEGSTAVVRWRNKLDANGEIVIGADGKPVRESNARLLRWSDGTVQLVVGDAIFQCKNLDVDNCYIYEQQAVQVIPEDQVESVTASDNVLECVGSVQKRLVLQPLSLDSESHARMSMKISEKFKKESKIRDRDYEQISEKPEKTLADLAKQADEEDRRERRARERQYGSASGNTITGAARFIKRPTMSADYLAAGYDDYDEEEAEHDDNRARKHSQQGVKAGKKKSSVAPDYLEYDEEDGSEEEYDDDPDEEGEDEDEGEGEDLEDNEEDDEEEDEDDDEEDEESQEDGEVGDSDGEVQKKKSKSKDGARKGKKDKDNKKARKQEKKDRKRRKEEKRAARREEKKKNSKRKVSEEEEDEDDEGEMKGVVKVGIGAPSSPVRAGGDEGEEDEEMNMQQRKRTKRTIIDSDDEE
mmetsp:Transcript_70938/g.139324  ORF Transcript_70938/g.139324 Transcript_70938/m.139324 type:complete len:571 (+) Transcript_70938:3-1715(+)